MKIITSGFRSLTRRSVALHQHDHWEFHYICSGGCSFKIKEEVLRIAKGDIFAVPPLVDHGVWMETPQQWLMQYLFGIVPENKQDRELLTRWHDFSSGRCIAAGQQLHGIMEKIILDHKGNSIQQQGAGYHVGSLLCQLMSDRSGAKAQLHPAISKSISLMQQHLHEHLKLDDLCAKIHLDKSYFIRLFKKELKITPQAYQRRLQLNVAITRLSDPEQSVQSIAEELGFSSASQFSRCFKQHFGTSPKDYHKHKATSLT